MAAATALSTKLLELRLMRTNQDRTLPPEFNRNEARAQLARQIGRLLAREWHRLKTLKSRGENDSSTVPTASGTTAELPVDSGLDLHKKH
jgi:hypothetical protein